MIVRNNDSTTNKTQKKTKRSVSKAMKVPNKCPSILLLQKVLLLRHTSSSSWSRPVAGVAWLSFVYNPLPCTSCKSTSTYKPWADGQCYRVLARLTPVNEHIHPDFVSSQHVWTYNKRAIQTSIIMLLSHIYTVGAGSVLRDWLQRECTRSDRVFHMKTAVTLLQACYT